MMMFRSELRLARLSVFYYVHILSSESGEHFCTGFAKDLSVRLAHHNSGGDPHTAKHKPWRTKTAIAFTNREHALAVERYLKTRSGRAFTKKRL